MENISEVEKAVPAARIFNGAFCLLCQLTFILHGVKIKINLLFIK